MSKRKDPLGGNPLSKQPEGDTALPGMKSDLLGGRTKRFGYDLPENLGVAFKIYCQARGLTTSQTMQEVLAEFLEGKEIYPR